MVDSVPRVLILGGGAAGFVAARRLQKLAAHVPMRITLVDKNPYYTYLPFLPEVAGGHIAAKDVTVELRRALRKTRVLQGAVVGISAAQRTVTVHTAAGEDRTLDYDHLIIALGSVSRVFPTPGLDEYAVGFKTVEEAAFVRARLLRNIATAASTKDSAERRRLLTGVFVGGGYTGVEAIGELVDTSNAAIASYPSLRGEKPRWILIDALDRIAPEVGVDLSKWTLGSLRSRGVDVRLRTTMPSVEDGVVQLSDGDSFPAALVVWTAGVKPNPVLEASDLPRGPKGHVIANAFLQVTEAGTHAPVTGVWALGDAAQVPDFTAEHQPAFYVPNAQNAVRQAVVVADNVAAQIAGKHLTKFRHPSIGTVAAYGVGKGAANIRGVHLTNWAAWFMHRSYHLYAMPTLRRKFHILLGWFTGAVSGRDSTSLTDEAAARATFADASKN